MATEFRGARFRGPITPMPPISRGGRVTTRMRDIPNGQMADLIRLEVGDDQKKIRKILHYTGLPCDARSITNAVLQMEAKTTEKIVRIGVDKRVATKAASED